MSNIVHYIDPSYIGPPQKPVEQWRTLCGIRAKDREFDATWKREDVECTKCRALLGDKSLAQGLEEKP